MTDGLKLAITGVLLLNLDGPVKVLGRIFGRGLTAVAAVIFTGIATFLTAVERTEVVVVVVPCSRPLQILSVPSFVFACVLYFNFFALNIE